MSEPEELQEHAAAEHLVSVWMNDDDPPVPTHLTDEAGAWVPVPRLRCQELIRGVSPTMDEAKLTWLFGSISFTDDAGPIAYVAAKDLVGAYVRVEVPAWSVDWVGYVLLETTPRQAEETFDPGGGPEQRVAGGVQSFTAKGLEYFLGRRQIAFSNIYEGEAELRRIDRAIGYNAGMGDGRSIDYELRANKDSRDIAFAADFEHAEEWTAADILKDLVGYVDDADEAISYRGSYTISDKDAVESVKLRLAAAAVDYLKWYKPTIFTENRSILQAIDDVIDRRRGLVWWLTYNHEFGRAEINVASNAVTEMELPGTIDELPAAAVQVTLGDDPRVRPTIAKSVDRRADVVHVRGGRRRTVCTASIASGNLTPSWKSSEKTAYDLAADSDEAAENDLVRTAERLQRVYSTFHLSQTWDGLANDGSGPPDPTAYACPKPPQGSTTFEEGQYETFSPYGLRLLRTMPILVGWDYTDATAPTSRDPDNLHGEFQQPFGVVEVEGQWHLLHRLGLVNDDSADLSPYGLNMLSSAPGLQITNSAHLNHVAALNHFDPETAAVSDTDPQVDYEDMRFTVCIEFDACCEAQWPHPDAEPTSQPIIRQYISIGDRARFDWLAEGTIFDAEGGALKSVTTGGALRDDRNLCETVAKIAHQWYGVPRAELSIDVDSLDLGEALVGLGDLITTVGTAEAVETVNATVTQILMDVAHSKASISAGFAELDFSGVV